MSTRRRFIHTLGVAPAVGSAVGASGAAGKSKLGIGLIGSGARGNSLANTVRGLAKKGMPADIVAVCDIYQPRREKTAAKFGVKGYASAAELLKDPAVDGVIVATPDRVHVYKALEATRAGKDVYCEKPLTHWQQFEKLKELVREVRAKGNVFQVGAQWVSDPAWLRAAKLVKDGAIGKPTHALTGYFRHSDFGENGMPIDDPNATPGPGLNWDAFQADAPHRPFNVDRFFRWRMFMDYSGGPSTDLYPHPMTRLFKVLGVNFPSKVTALGGLYLYGGGRDVPDTFDLLIEYPEKLNVVVIGSITNDTPTDTVIRATEATLTFRDTTFDLQPEYGSKVARPASGVPIDYQTEHMRNFLESMQSRTKPNCDIELGYRVQIPLIMAMQSFTQGKVAYFDSGTETIHLS
ncbi:MAG: Gfo/Idh/MocA family oxidoreductase [Bryobacterales bacterium]|nr:Gfo/Idh/MocA family oxidoreductase [Bryobacterales bacterium]